MKNALISNTTTFAELVAILKRSPEALKAARHEAEACQEEDYEAELRKLMGDAYEAPITRKRRCPGVNQLRTTSTLIAEVAICHKGLCQVFSNGYGIYDNGHRKTVVWIPGCKRSTYYFTELTDNEKQYQTDRIHLDEAETGSLLWYEALMIRGEDRIENNSKFPVTIGTCSDFEEDPENVKPEPKWYGHVHIDEPEVAYLKKEKREETLALLSDKQREIFIMYFQEGYNQREIAEMLGMNIDTVETHVRRAKAKIKNNGFEIIYG